MYTAGGPGGTDEWSEWSECTASCGGGTQFRTKQCQEDNANCEVEEQECNTDDCNPEPELRGIRGNYLIVELCTQSHALYLSYPC